MCGIGGFQLKDAEATETERKRTCVHCRQG